MALNALAFNCSLKSAGGDESSSPRALLGQFVAVVGNEDGAHRCAADIYRALNDLGFALPPTAVTYWVGEAMTGRTTANSKRRRRRPHWRRRWPHPPPRTSRACPRHSRIRG